MPRLFAKYCLSHVAVLECQLLLVPLYSDAILDVLTSENVLRRITSVQGFPKQGESFIRANF